MVYLLPGYLGGVLVLLGASGPTEAILLDMK
jgi:hypothetical protein